MIETTPKVRLVSEPHVNLEAMMSYLRDVGGEEWMESRMKNSDWPDSELLVEFCGRLCYKSWKPGLNANVTKIRQDRGEYLLNILTTRHGSVIEHAHFMFILQDVSRVLTAELNRHRHPNISEQSLRYVRLDKDIPFRMPPMLNPETQRLGHRLLIQIEDTIAKMYQSEGIHTMDDFAQKKTITSAVRRFAPMGISTHEVWTANLRDIRHVIEMRTDPAAEEEIRIVAHQIARIMANRAPFMFQDYRVQYDADELEVGHWVTENRKV